MIKVGDLVTPSSLCRTREWWGNVKYMANGEFLVTKVEKGNPCFVSFHDPVKGIRRWSSSNLSLVVISLENE